MPRHRRIKRRLPKKVKLPKLLKLPMTTPMRVQRAHINPEQMLARQEECLRLRVDEGLPIRDIAKRMGISVGKVHDDVKTIARMKYAGMIEKDELVILESNARYDQIISTWLPFLKPFAEGKLVVGETKVDRQGKEYDITIPTYEAAKTATEMLLKASSQRERLNGFLSDKPAKSQAEEVGDQTTRILEMVGRWFADKKPIQAEIIENRIENG